MLNDGLGALLKRGDVLADEIQGGHLAGGVA